MGIKTVAEIKRYKRVLEWSLKGDRLCYQKYGDDLFITAPDGYCAFRFNKGADFLSTANMHEIIGEHIYDLTSMTPNLIRTGRTVEAKSGKRMYKKIEFKRKDGKLIYVEAYIADFFPDKECYYWQYDPELDGNAIKMRSNKDAVHVLSIKSGETIGVMMPLREAPIGED